MSLRVRQEVQTLSRAAGLIGTVETSVPHIDVVAGVLVDAHGRVLVAQRPPGLHMAGRWEFPGGKLEPGETPQSGLGRELEEELGIRVRAARPLIRCRHTYPDRRVTLDVWLVNDYSGRIHGHDGQALEWVAPDALPAVDLLEADRPIVNAIRLPSRYFISPDPRHDEQGFAGLVGAVLEKKRVRLMQLRVPGGTPREIELFAGRVVPICRRFSCRLILNGDPRELRDLAVAIGADGIHVPGRFLERLRERPLDRRLFLGVSCHNGAELEKAERLDADFAVLGPVKPTASHPGAAAMGWSEFAALARDANLPVYGLGGLGERDLEEAQRAGGQGVAAISAFLR